MTYRIKVGRNAWAVLSVADERAENADDAYALGRRAVGRDLLVAGEVAEALRWLAVKHPDERKIQIEAYG